MKALIIIDKRQRKIEKLFSGAKFKAVCPIRSVTRILNGRHTEQYLQLEFCKRGRILMIMS